MLTPIQFIYWLKGILDTTTGGICIEITQIITKKLDSVFDHGDKQTDVSKVKPTLQELIPNHTVTYSDVPLKPKPADWKPDWEHCSLHGWYDPKYGKPRC